MKYNKSFINGLHMFLTFYVVTFSEIFKITFEFQKDIPEFLGSGRKSWTLDSGCWTLDSEPWTQDVGLWTLNARLWTLKL